MSAIALTLIIISAVLVRGGIKGLSPVESFTDIFDRAGGGPGIAAPGAPGAGTLPGGTGGYPGQTDRFPAAVERWRGLVGAHFPAGVVDQALSVMQCESQGNPQATNPSSGAAGLFQHMPQFWSERSRSAGVPGANIYDPSSNVRVAAWLYKQSNSWKHWSCQPTVN